MSTCLKELRSIDLSTSTKKVEDKSWVGGGQLIEQNPSILVFFGYVSWDQKLKELDKRLEQQTPLSLC